MGNFYFLVFFSNKIKSCWLLSVFRLGKINLPQKQAFLFYKNIQIRPFIFTHENKSLTQEKTISLKSPYI